MIAVASLFLLFVVCTFLSGWLAARRGRSAKLWSWMGFIFGPLAPLAIALLPPVPVPASN